MLFTTAAAAKAGTALDVEPDPVVIQYATRGGGRPSSTSSIHMQHNIDLICIAHNSSQNCLPYVNTRVTTEDISGASPSPGATSSSACRTYQFMGEVPYPGADTDIPNRALTFLINRYGTVGPLFCSFLARGNVDSVQQLQYVAFSNHVICLVSVHARPR